MRKSRLLSLLLTVVFILANVTIPSFANTTLTAAEIIGIGPVVAPIEGMPYHISHAVDGDATYAYSKEATGVTVSEDGILSIGSNVGTSYNEGALSVNVGGNVVITTADSTVNGPSLGNVFNSFNYTFDDGKTPNDTGVYMAGDRSALLYCEITSDASGRYYAKTASGKSYMRIYGQSALIGRSKTAPFVFEMEMLNLTESITFGDNMPFLTIDTADKISSAWIEQAVSSGATVSEDFDFANFKTNGSGWNNYKWIITPNQYTIGDVTYYPHFDLFINDQFVMGNVLLKGPGTDYSLQYGHSSNYMARFIYAGGIDNYKRYGTSLGFAHDVQIGSNGTGVGATLTASASKYTMPTSNVSESLEYAFFTSADGEDYTFLASGSSYTTKASDDSKFIKSAARVKDFDGCTTDWVLSDDSVYVDAPVEFVYGNPAETLKAANVVAPVAGLPLRISHKVNKDATYALAKTTAGITVDANGFLNIAPDTIDLHTRSVKVSDKVTTTLKDGSTLTGPTLNNVYASYNYNFEDGRLPNDPEYAYPTNERWALSMFEVTSDASGRIYAGRKSNYLFMRAENALYTRLTALAPVVWEFEAKNMWAPISFGGTTLIGANGSNELNPTWLETIKTAGATINPDFNTKISLKGWHHYKWVITSTTYGTDENKVTPNFDLYIDNELFASNIPMTSAQVDGSWNVSSATANYSCNVYTDGIDNYKYYGTSLGFAHDVNFTGDAVVGSTITLNAQKATMPMYNIPETLEKAIFVADSADAQYTLVEESIGNTFTLTDDLAGKYIKAAARVKEDIEGGLATEWVLSNDAVFVPDSNISSIALKVDGADADINAVNLAGKTEAQIDITITAASADGKDAKFVLAQYATVAGKKVLVGAALNDADLTEAANTFDLSLKASNIDAGTTFRLFIIAKEGLVPVKDIVLK